MQIKELRLTNFCGIRSTTFSPQSINVLLGANGTGKTTLLNGIRYALTGAEPDGPIIYSGADVCTVSITLSDPVTGEAIEFTRIKQEGKPSKYKIDGIATTLRALNEKMEAVLGIPLEKISITSSSELIAAMKPQEFSSFILDYIPKKSSLTDIIAFISDASAEMIDIMEKYLPSENVDMEALENFERFCRATRSDLKTILSKRTSLYASMPQKDPGYNSLALKKRLQEIANYVGAKSLYLQKLTHYNKAMETRRKCESSIVELKAKIEGISAERPNPIELSKLTEEADGYKKSISNQKIAIAGVYSAINQLRITLDALEKPICPISSLITCHQDKTVAKKDVSESIKSSEDGLSALNEELVNAEKRLSETSTRIDKYNANVIAYNEKIALSKQVMALESALPEVPLKPDPFEEIDVAAEETLIKNKLSLQEKYLEGQHLLSQIEALNTELCTYEKLCKAFAEKGPVKTGIITSYLKVFENICNERSTKFRPDTTFEFRGDDGIVVLMSNGKKSADGEEQMLPYKALSGGEKAYMLFILMDMLNQLTGARLLFLDEMNIMDKSVLSSLLDILKDAKVYYDHVFLSSVNHSDIEEVFREKGLLRTTAV